MTLGNQPLSCGATPRRNRLRSFQVLAAVLLMLSATSFLAGCGGGGSPKPSPSSTPTASATTATITGRVVDRYSGNNGVDGLTVTFDNGSRTLTTTTSGGGNFTLNVSSGLGNRILKVNVPTDTYYDNAQVQGGTYSIASSGFTVPSLTDGQNYNTGEIAIASVSAGPPPPPIFP